MSDVDDCRGVRFLFDENIQPKIAEAMRLVGYNVWSNRDLALRTAPDEEVIDYCGDHRLVWVTQDLDCRKRDAYQARVQAKRVSAVFMDAPKAKGWTTIELFEVLVHHLRQLESRYERADGPRYFFCRAKGSPREVPTFASRFGR